MGVEEGEDMGHEYDGIRELNNPLPKWWTYLFVSTFVFAAVYLALFPGLGSFKGFLNWQSSAQTVQMNFRIADTFRSSLAKLNADEQKAAKTAVFRKAEVSLAKYRS